MGYIYFLVKILFIAKIINIPQFITYFAIILQEVFSLSKEIIRKTNSYHIQTKSLHEEFRTSFMEFNNLIDDLAINLKRIIRSFNTYSDTQKQAPILLSKKESSMMESIYYKISKISSKTDEILQNIGGLEFSTNPFIDEFISVLRDIEIQYNHVIKCIMTFETNSKIFTYESKSGYDLNEYLSHLEIEFALLQEIIQNLMPKVNLLFDELKKDECNAMKFNSINQF